ncbi:glycosyltransferase [Paraburkholderia madseniana]|uniref:glycosyltransferase n=1 Tax=Paraburkholderia madseniana TaxID=2599607 RepID=UPI0038BC8F20
MKALLVNYSDHGGGAARAGTRLFDALLHSGLDARLLVRKKISERPDIQGPETDFERIYHLLRPRVGSKVQSLFRTSNKVLHSFGVLPSDLPKYLNAQDVDVVNLHWICNEMLSIEGLGRVRKPIVWTLHDMWGFCGAEHYTSDARWKDGYTKATRHESEKGFDLNRWVWLRKQRSWLDPMTVIAPSRWLARCAQESALMCKWKVHVVPNAIDTSFWAPVDKAFARKVLNLRPDERYVLFSSFGGTGDSRKGFDLLIKAVKSTSNLRNDTKYLVLGEDTGGRAELCRDLSITFLGYLNDEVSLKVVYSAVDAVVIPSRLDNLPNIGVEALACGTPVVAFDVGGLSDIVENGVTGFLAEPNNPESLGLAIEECLDKRSNSEISAWCRDAAVRKYSFSVIAEQYRNVFLDVAKN